MSAVMNNETAKHFIETKTTSYIQAYTLIEAIIPCILSLFIGPWMDENGRKWPIVCKTGRMQETTNNQLNSISLSLVRVLHFLDPNSGWLFGIVIGGGSGNLVFSPAIHFCIRWRWISYLWSMCVQVRRINIICTIESE